MTLPLLIAALALGPAAAPPPEDEALVVVAQKLRKIKYWVGKDRKTGAMICRVRRSSGDERLDARICEVAKGCIPADATRNDGARVSACIEAGAGPIVAEFAAERRAAALRR